MPRPRGYAPTFTMLLADNNQIVEVSFQTNKLNLELNTDKYTIKSISASPKDNGLSLVFVRPDTIISIVRDTSVDNYVEPEYNEDEGEDSEDAQ